MSTRLHKGLMCRLYLIRNIHLSKKVQVYPQSLLKCFLIVKKNLFFPL